ncbi:hypothetical protein AX774_g4238 [Zancudomyces culisetae]|uniref:Uncharacterized protein n=1 Tax=Zancudomyces culisetae TaxID=1213189 RepID=A0A1R1PMU4_ZANCU|nr:hypothetical protein AX774_g4238 [Zancudomyces culisetae]|eukprot:OMH82290.1 hypothetical protein AX774_g4238 [Zancudomyces culisetae]
MIKSAVLTALVLSSTFAYSVQDSQNAQNAQNQDVQGSGKSSVNESKFNEMRPKKRRMQMILFRSTKFRLPQGTFYARPNKCYSASQFRGVRMGNVRGKKGVVMFCTLPNCMGRCHVVSRRITSQISDFSYQIRGYATSYAWISPYF